MSGGVDSSVAAVVLKERGYEVLGCTLWLYGEKPTEAEKAQRICEQLGLKHIVLDFRADFKNTVIKNFTNEYLCGNTPNPCIVCNRYIKFQKMLEAADENGCRYIATGHYAKKDEVGGRAVIYRPSDRQKDQTYMLYSLTQDELKRTIFPLYDTPKSRVREIAEQYGFENAKQKDSQDICFVPDGNYAAFIEDVCGVKSCKGNFVDINDRILGEHNGIINYTIGQRKGLGIALGKPAFVLKKDAKTNKVVLDTDEARLFYRRVLVKNLNFLPFENLSEPMRLSAKLRYRHEAQPCTITPYNDKVIIEFDEPQRAPSSGQSAVFYDGDLLVGGGIIEGEPNE